MRNLLVFIGLICFNISLYSQEETKKNEKFARHFSYVSFFKDGKWEEPIKRNSTFVFNINDNGDVLLYLPNGDKKYFRSISSVTEHKIDKGIKVQAVEILDEDGDELLLFLYENGVLVLAYNKDSMIRFHP
ncbi:hypothetical protein [Capnocytophaga stomatis]|nr:hypothetical protein [Capnocytophaga stomatis]